MEWFRCRIANDGDEKGMLWKSATVPAAVNPSLCFVATWPLSVKLGREGAAKG